MASIEGYGLGITDHVKGIHKNSQIGTFSGGLVIDGFHGDVTTRLKAAVKQVIQKSKTGAKIGIVRGNVELNAASFALRYR